MNNFDSYNDLLVLQRRSSFHFLGETLQDIQNPFDIDEQLVNGIEALEASEFHRGFSMKRECDTLLRKRSLSDQSTDGEEPGTDRIEPEEQVLKRARLVMPEPDHFVIPMIDLNLLEDSPVVEPVLANRDSNMNLPIIGNDVDKILQMDPQRTTLSNVAEEEVLQQPKKRAAHVRLVKTKRMGKAELKKAEKFWDIYRFKRANELFQIAGAEIVERLCQHLMVNEGEGDNKRDFKQLLSNLELKIRRLDKYQAVYNDDFDEKRQKRKNSHERKWRYDAQQQRVDELKKEMANEPRVIPFGDLTDTDKMEISAKMRKMLDLWE